MASRVLFARVRACTTLLALAGVYMSVSVCSAFGPQGGNGTLYIIRHGEKVSSKGCLSSQGKARAKALVGIYSQGGRFRSPLALFAHNYDEKSECERCTQTVAPLSQHLGLKIDDKCVHAHPLCTCWPRVCACSGAVRCPPGLSMCPSTLCALELRDG